MKDQNNPQDFEATAEFPIIEIDPTVTGVSNTSETEVTTTTFPVLDASATTQETTSFNNDPTHRNTNVPRGTTSQPVSYTHLTLPTNREV